MTSNLTTRIKIADLATEFSVSESYLRKNFKLQYGITIHQYLLQITMAYALSAIKKGERITELALRLGYDYPPSFTRAFKSIHQVTPESYKR